MGGEGTSYNTNIWFNPPGDEPPERWSGLGPTLRDDDVSKFGRPVSQPVPTYDQLSNDLVESGTTDGVEEMNVYNYYRRQYNGATSAEDVAELNRRLAPWWNFTVPSFHLTIRSDGVWGDTDNWQWPSEGSEAYTKGTLPRAEMIKNGRVAPK
jgi:hypothetical protein